MDLTSNSMIGSFVVSNWLSGKLIVLILIFFSVGAWAIMVTKFREIRMASRETDRFMNSFRRETHPMALFLRRQPLPSSPLAKVYEAGCAALGSEVDHASPHGGAMEDFTRRDSLSMPRLQISALQTEVVRRATERTADDELLVLESRMGLLMSAISVSPLLGLLGTVWGVLESFWAMAQGGSANISAVAPGIASALLTTVIGLLVAIPSTLGYNMLSGQIRTLTVRMDNFAQEFLAAMQREYSRDGAGR